MKGARAHFFPFLKCYLFYLFIFITELHKSLLQRSESGRGGFKCRGHFIPGVQMAGQTVSGGGDDGVSSHIKTTREDALSGKLALHHHRLV